MISPRSIICTAERSAARAWSGPLSAVGSTVDVVERWDQVDSRADLVLAHPKPDELPRLASALSSLDPGASSVVVLPEPGLGPFLKALQVPTVRAAVARDYADSRLLTYVACKLTRGDIFGLSKVMPWGVHIHSLLVNNHDERTQALATAMQFAKSMGVRGKYRESIELVVDELLMNALYNAPVGPQGPLFGDVAPKDRSNLRLERPAIVQLACDGSRFAVGVRDSFGSLEPTTVLNYLERCLTSQDQIERKASGAGLGLYLVANNVTEMVVNVLPGTATEMLCVFDLKAPGQQLKHFGIYHETFARHAEMGSAGGGERKLVGTAGAAGPQKGSPLIGVTLVTAVLVLLVAGLLLVWPHLTGPATGALSVTVSPPGATIYLNGVRRGAAKPTLKLDDLEVGSPYEVSAKLPGYRTAEEVTSVQKGQTAKVQLRLRQMAGRVRVTSTPSDAEIWIDGKQTAQRTPALLDGLAPGKSYKVRLVKHGYLASMGELTPSAEETLLYHVNLNLGQAFGRLSVQSDPPGARLYVNDVDTGQTTPVDGYVLRSKQSYRIRVEAPMRVPYEEEIKPKEGDLVRREVRLRPGAKVTITANVPARVLLDNRPVGNLPLTEAMLPAGQRRLRLRSNNPYLDHTLPLRLKQGEAVRRDLVFGFVTVKEGSSSAIKVGRTKVRRLALAPGKHRVTVVDGANKAHTVQVTVSARADAVVE